MRGYGRKDKRGCVKTQKNVQTTPSLRDSTLHQGVGKKEQ
jgi:hypothetical protein